MIFETRVVFLESLIKRHLKSVKSLRLALAQFALLLPLIGTAQTPSAALAFEQEGNGLKLCKSGVRLLGRIQRSPRRFASLGIDLAKQQNYKEAVAAYKRALALNPGFQACR